MRFDLCLMLIFFGDGLVFGSRFPMDPPNPHFPSLGTLCNHGLSHHIYSIAGGFDLVWMDQLGGRSLRLLKWIIFTWRIWKEILFFPLIFSLAPLNELDLTIAVNFSIFCFNSSISSDILTTTADLSLTQLLLSSYSISASLMAANIKLSKLVDSLVWRNVIQSLVC